MLPPEGRCRPAMQRPTVVLPLPDSPTSATQRPWLDARTRRRRPPGGRAAAAVARLERGDLEQRRRSASARPREPPPVVRAARLRRAQQRTACPGTVSSSAGTAAAQPATACSQRGAKAQPAGPLADTDRDAADSPQRARVAEVGDGLDERARVRDGAAARYVGGRAVLDHAAGVHDDDAVGHRATTARSCET